MRFPASMDLAKVRRNKAIEAKYGETSGGRHVVVAPETCAQQLESVARRRDGQWAAGLHQLKALKLAEEKATAERAPNPF